MRRLRWSLSLLALGWAVLVAGLAADLRRPSPEPTIRAYLADLEGHRLEEAAGALSPAARDRWGDFLEFQQFNRYEVVSLAVRSPSLLEVVLGQGPWRPDQATLVADVIEPSGVRWRGRTLVPLAYEGGRWYLLRPPFAPD